MQNVGDSNLEAVFKPKDCRCSILKSLIKYYLIYCFHLKNGPSLSVNHIVSLYEDALDQKR